MSRPGGFLLPGLFTLTPGPATLPAKGFWIDWTHAFLLLDLPIFMSSRTSNLFRKMLWDSDPKAGARVRNPHESGWPQDDESLLCTSQRHSRGRAQTEEFEVFLRMRARVYPITFGVFLWVYQKYFTILIISSTESFLFLPRTGSLSLARPSFSTGSALQFPTFGSHLFTSASRASFLFSHLYSNVRACCQGVT